MSEIDRSLVDRPQAAHFRDRDFIKTTIADVFAPHDLDVTRGSVLDGSFHLGAADSLRVVWLAYGAPVRIDAPPLEHPLHVIQIPLRGHASVASGSDQVISDSAIASIPDPRRGTSMHWEADCSQMILRVDDDVLQRQLESMLGYPVKAPIHFALAMQLDSGPTRSWRAAVDLLAVEIQRGGGLLESPLVTSRLESFILAGLLTAQPHNYTSTLLADQRPAPSRVVRHAMECIETHPEQALTTARLAASAGVSARPATWIPRAGRLFANGISSLCPPQTSEGRPRRCQRRIGFDGDGRCTGMGLHASGTIHPASTRRRRGTNTSRNQQGPCSQAHRMHGPRCDTSAGARRSLRLSRHGVRRSRQLGLSCH